MSYFYETVQRNENIPIKIFTHELEYSPYHWHREIEILFVLNGEVDIKIGNDKYNVLENEIFIINPNEIHFISSKATDNKAKILVLQFSANVFKKYNLDISDMFFRIESKKNEENKEMFYNMKSILANIMNVVINDESLLRLKVEKLLIELIIIMINNFNVEGAGNKDIAFHYDERINKILKFIDDKSNEQSLSINKIANEFYLTPEYLSKYFKKNVGISLKKFINVIRLNKSLYDLKLNNENISDIAYKFGFPDTKSYYRVFKENIGTTPVQYRKTYKIEVENKNKLSYLNVNSETSLSSLFKYLKYNTNDTETYSPIYDTVVIDAKVKGEFRENNYANLTTFGYAPHGLRSDFESQLKEAQRCIKFKHIRFHGIFSDEMLIYNEDNEREVYYNFNHLDALLDIILKNELTPFIELGFMPTQLSSNEETVFLWKANISPPKKIEKWKNLIEEFLKHVINRYGIDNIRKWHFEFWNEPEFGGLFWSSDKKTFFNFFLETYKSVKSIDKEIKIGGFGTVNLENSKLWLKSFEKFCIKKKIKLDFYSFHIYLTTISNRDDNLLDSKLTIDKIRKMELSKTGNIKLGNSEYLKESTNKILKNVENDIFSSNYWITEWNASTNSRDLTHDTCFMASFIVKNTLSISDKVSGMGYWSLSDIFEEQRLEQPLFHGGFGLMTYNGLKKPSFHAFYFMKKLFEEIIYISDSAIVTKNNEDYGIIIFNYIHYNELYKKNDHSQISQKVRYNVFENNNKKEISLILENIEGDYLVEEEWVNRKNGSVYDAWLEIGAPEKLTKEAYIKLKANSEVGYKTYGINTKGNFKINLRLLPHEVRYISIKKKY